MASIPQIFQQTAHIRGLGLRRSVPGHIRNPVQQLPTPARRLLSGNDKFLRFIRQVHLVQPGLHTKDNREQVGKVMRKATCHLRRHRSATCLLQGNPRLCFFGNVHRHDIDTPCPIRCE